MKEKIAKKTRENILAIIGIAMLANVGGAIAIRWGYIEVDWIIYMNIFTLLPLYGAGMALKSVPTLEE